MSGLEVLGIAASIVQIAEIGTQLAVKLCAFYHKVKTADQRIQNLSNNVALTSSVLKLLGDNLQKDEQAKLYSQQAFGTTQGVLDECKSVFEQIRDAIDQSPTKGLFQRAAKKLSFVVMEEELELLGRNLERLKSTLHLMLNVIMYAGQLRSRTEPTALKDQRELIQSLLDHKKVTERRFEEMTRALEGAKLNNDQPKSLQPEHLMCAATLPTPTENPLAALGKYYLLVKKLLQDVDSYRAGLEQSQHSRVRNGVLRIHNEEIQHMEVSHGPQMAQMFRNRIYELSDRPTEVEQHIFGSQEAYAEPPRPSDAFLREQAKAAAQAQSARPQMRPIEVLAECNQSITQNQPNISKPPSQPAPSQPAPSRPAPAPQSPAPIQSLPSHPFLDTIRALSRLSPAQLSQIDRVAESIRDRMDKSTLERVEAQLHMVNAGRYDGDIVQLFFRRQALEQLRKRQNQLRMGMTGSLPVDPRNLTNGSPDINGQPAQQQQQQQQQRTQPIINPISIYPAQGDVDLNESHWSTQSDNLSRKRRGRSSPISARQPSPYRSHYADPLGSNRISPIRHHQQPPGRSEYLSTPPFVLDSQELSPSGVPHRRSRSDHYASLIKGGDLEQPEYVSRRTSRQHPTLPLHGSSPREEDHSHGVTKRKKRRSASLDDDSSTNPSPSGTERADDPPFQGADGPVGTAAPDEIDDLVLQWTTVGGDEIASALRVD